MLRFVGLALVLTAVSIFSFQSMAQRYKYTDLMLKDYDEVSKAVQTRLTKAREISAKASAQEGEDMSASDTEAVEQLRDALLLLMSRPDKDNLIAKLMPDLRKELTNYKAFEDTFSSVTSEAIAGLVNDKLPVIDRSTYLFVLENIMSEVKAQAKERADYRKILEKIRDAKIKIPKDVVNDRKLRSMYTAESPSELADKILKKLPPLKTP